MRALAMPRRAGFSLLEMVLSVAIGTLLLLALYVTLNTHILHGQAGRDVLNEGALARNILTAIANDITSQLGAVDPRGLPDYSALANASTPTDGTTTASSTTTSTTAPTTTQDAAVAFNLGVSGDSQTLIISGARVQKPRAAATGSSADAADEKKSDLRRVSYWLVASGADSLGLARHETKQCTAAEVDIVPTELGDQNKYIVAKEVKSVTFEYFDGASWQASWSGSSPAGEDGAPLGPPAAVRITITLRRIMHGVAEESLANEQGPTYSHVVAIPTGNTFTQK